ncbi:MAG: alpha/beta hydrolase family protein [Byssovorax cruenta]
MRKLIPWLALVLIACAALATPVALPTARPIAPAATVITPTSLPTQTLAPYEQYTIDYLRKRTYGGGKIEVLQTLADTDSFSGYAIRYPSDGLNIYGFMTIPKGPGPFPVIVSIHAYAPPGTYDPFNVEADFADFFAANQFIVVHPELRNQPPSDSGDNLLRVGMTTDVMNLIALLKARNDLPMELATANIDQLGLWGMSLGGEIALRVITISSDIKATVLYSALSGDEKRNSQQLSIVLQDAQFQQDSQLPLEMFDRVSPMYYYNRVTSVVQLNHGLNDKTAPISWAVETCDFLQAAGVSVQCIYYPEVGHVFGGDIREKMKQNALEFYQAHLLQ